MHIKQQKKIIFHSLFGRRVNDCLSRADIFQRRIKRWQHWRFLVYVNALMTAGIALSKETDKNRFVAGISPRRGNRNNKIIKRTYYTETDSNFKGINA